MLHKIDYVYPIITDIWLWFSVRLPITVAWHCHSLYAAFSSNVGVCSMWACSLFLLLCYRLMWNLHCSLGINGHGFCSYPYPRIFNKVWIVLHCNATNQSLQNNLHMNQHNFDNPLTSRPPRIRMIQQ